MRISWVGSPNYTAGRGGYKISGIVIHWMDGTLASADSTFQNRVRNTSAHYGVEDDVVHQYVAEENTAYQAGNWIVNEQTLGIEHSAEPGRAPSDGTYESSAQIVAAAAKKYGFPIDANHIRHHYDVVATQCSGQVSNGGVDEARILKRALEIAGGQPVPTPSPAPAPAPINTGGTAVVTTDLLYVRAAPSSGSALAGSQQLKRGDTFHFKSAIQGENVGGVSTWLLSDYGHYVWAGGTNYPTTPPVHATGGVAQAVRATNVRSQPSTSAPLAGSQQLSAGAEFDYTALVHGQLVNQNGISSDLWAHSTRGNYVWWGNCRKIS
jgi:hypothetical protein